MSGQGAERARPATIEHLLRDLSPQVLGLVVRRFRDFAAAEDAVQEALLAAAMQWPREGLPDEPRAWLVRVAPRRIADHVRAETARRRRETFVVSLAPPEEQLVRSMDDCELFIGEIKNFFECLAQELISHPIANYFVPV